MTTETSPQTLERKNGYYTIQDGDYHAQLPSVTTILQVISKPALYNWYAKLGKDEANRVKQESADFGSTLHRLVQEILEGKTPELDGMDPVIVGCITSFREWARLVQLKPLLAPETTVYSKTHGYAGTADLIATVYGVPAVIDWKTASGIYPEMELQAVAYGRAVEEMGLVTPRLHMIVRFDKKTAQCHPCVVTANEGAFQAFLAAQQLWQWLHDAETGRQP